MKSTPKQAAQLSISEENTTKLRAKFGIPQDSLKNLNIRIFKTPVAPGFGRIRPSPPGQSQRSAILHFFKYSVNFNLRRVLSDVI